MTTGAVTPIVNSPRVLSPTGLAPPTTNVGQTPHPHPVGDYPSPCVLPPTGRSPTGWVSPNVVGDSPWGGVRRIFLNVYAYLPRVAQYAAPKCTIGGRNPRSRAPQARFSLARPMQGKWVTGPVSLAGRASKMSRHGVDPNGAILHFGDACTDCVVYLANGDEPQEEVA